MTRQSPARPAQRISRMLRAFSGASPERPGGRGKPRLAIVICSAPDIPAARPAVGFRVPLREPERKINSRYQPAGLAAQADQFIAELWPRPAVLQAAEHAVLDHGHPGGPASVVEAARPVDGDQHEFRHGVIVTQRPDASTGPRAPRRDVRHPPSGGLVQPDNTPAQRGASPRLPGANASCMTAPIGRIVTTLRDELL